MLTCLLLPGLQFFIWPLSIFALCFLTPVITDLLWLPFPLSNFHSFKILCRSHGHPYFPSSPSPCYSSPTLSLTLARNCLAHLFPTIYFTAVQTPIFPLDLCSPHPCLWVPCKFLHFPFFMSRSLSSSSLRLACPWGNRGTTMLSVTALPRHLASSLLHHLVSFCLVSLSLADSTALRVSLSPLPLV